MFNSGVFDIFLFNGFSPRNFCTQMSGVLLNPEFWKDLFLFVIVPSLVGMYIIMKARMW
jgi:hypothetical protein